MKQLSTRDTTISQLPRCADSPARWTLVPAKAYPESLPADFRRHFREEWLPNRALDYFRRRDSEALQYLPKLIARNEPKKLN